MSGAAGAPLRKTRYNTLYLFKTFKCIQLQSAPWPRRLHQRHQCATNGIPWQGIDCLAASATTICNVHEGAWHVTVHPQVPEAMHVTSANIEEKTIFLLALGPGVKMAQQKKEQKTTKNKLTSLALAQANSQGKK